jgi:hypothetical protein
MKWRLNPKRSIISNRITRRAVTRGLNAYHNNMYKSKQDTKDCISQIAIVILAIIFIIALSKI